MSERRNTCIMNAYLKHYNYGNGCGVPEEKCSECKAHDYMPLGLCALFPNGFSDINKKQHGER